MDKNLVSFLKVIKNIRECDLEFYISSFKLFIFKLICLDLKLIYLK